jgi:hypothetical protein
MDTLLFHLIVIPGVFVIGYLTATVKVVGFRATIKERIKSYD